MIIEPGTIVRRTDGLGEYPIGDIDSVECYNVDIAHIAGVLVKFSTPGGVACCLSTETGGRWQVHDCEYGRVDEWNDCELVPSESA